MQKKFESDILIFEVLGNGNLQISLAPPSWDYDPNLELQDAILRNPQNTDSVLYDLLEVCGFLGNGWAANQNIGLTTAPNLIYMGDFDDDCDLVDFEAGWYFANYQIESFTDMLLDGQSVVFTRIPQPEPDVLGKLDEIL